MGGAGADEEGEVQPEPLDMSFPSSGIQKQCTYILLFPIIFPLWLTLPDTRKRSGENNISYNFINILFFLSLSLSLYRSFLTPSLFLSPLSTIPRFYVYVCNIFGRNVI